MRGVLRPGGPPKVYAGGMSKGTPYVQTAAAPRSNTTAAVPLSGLGYKGVLLIHLAGSASLAGAYWSDGNGGPQASGENAKWSYQCLGDETSFSLVQVNLNGYASGTANNGAPYMSFRINGGVNDGKELRVGSGATSNSYGAAGAPTSHATTTFATKLTTATLMGYGATRFYDNIIYYSDDTSYGPTQYSSYGSGTSNSAVYNGTTVTTNFNLNTTAGSSLVVGSTIYNDPPAKTQRQVGSNSGQRNGNSWGGLALVYLNDH